MKIKDYDEYDYDYTDCGSEYQKSRKKERGKDSYRSGKGHQYRRKESDYWADISTEELAPVILETQPVPKKEKSTIPVVTQQVVTPKVDIQLQGHPVDAAPSSSAPVSTGTPQFTAGPNTHTIKGNIIDFDRVANIEKVENEHNGNLTYGIKFLFLGKKGLSRIAWFNKNITERDRVFSSEYAFWQSLTHNQ